jgi:hypothetical protein
MYDTKKLIGELSGAVIAVSWIVWALLFPGNMLGLFIALAITILLGTLSGGFFALSDKENTLKEVIGWVLGAGIAVVWIGYALLGAGDMVFLVVAISLTIVLGVLSGGLIKLSQSNPK